MDTFLSVLLFLGVLGLAVFGLLSFASPKILSIIS